MKKIFTLLGTLFLASGMTVMAQDATESDGNEESSVKVDIKQANSYNTALTKDADGNWTLADFLASGTPFSFKFDKPAAIGDKAGITVTSNNKVDGDYCYLLDSDDKAIDIKISNYQGSGSEMTLSDPYIYNTLSYSYVKSFDAATDGYEYKATFTVRATDAASRTYTLYVSFSFNEPQSGDEPVNNDKCPVQVDIKQAASYTTDLSKDADGNWTLADFLASGTPFSFKFDKPAAIGDKAGITVTSNNKVDGDYCYLLDSDDKAIDIKISNYQGSGSEMTLSDPYIYNTLSYSYVKSFDAATDGYEYKATFTVRATNEASRTYTLYVSFCFNEPQNGDTSSVSVVSVENAPVEYYNLNGQRVAEPSNGIFIRKQGSAANKVVIR